MKIPRQKIWILAVNIVLTNAHNIFLIMALEYLPAGTAAGLMEGMIVIISAALLLLSSKTSKKLPMCVGSVVCLVGLVLMLQPDFLFHGLGFPEARKVNWTSPCKFNANLNIDGSTANGITDTMSNGSDIDANTNGRFNDSNTNDSIDDFDAFSSLDKFNTESNTDSHNGNQTADRTISMRNMYDYDMSDIITNVTDYATNISNASDNYNVTDNTNETILSDIVIGFILCFCHALCFALYAQSMNHLVDELTAATILFWNSLISAILTLAISFSFESVSAPGCALCWSLLFFHCIGSITLVLPWCVNYISPNICNLLAANKLVILTIMQYTVLRDIKPGLENWLEVLGTVVCFVGVIGGSLWDVLANHRKERNTFHIAQ